MSGRSWKQRTAVYTVTADSSFDPQSEWNTPTAFSDGRLYVSNLSVDDARAACRAYNKAAIAKRTVDKGAWDHQWMIAACCPRNKGLDRGCRP